ncbi:hypothetical protein FJU30_09265 [Affinibrenneria salicis]|uniref:Transposase DDE domain-containing protein n=1 Tax=Affinibrenneria salicis TaxID=2590031 RepID=A0A5J5G255_9GAMM|nr:hypothetical protein FJU30_09265 [Affinibrenneria salicis]
MIPCPDSAGRIVAKQKFKITNGKTYNHAPRQRGWLTVWVGDAAAAWYDTAVPKPRDSPLRYPDTAIATALMLRNILSLALRALRGFSDSVSHLMAMPLRCRITPASAHGPKVSTSISRRRRAVKSPIWSSMPAGCVP